MNNPRDFIPAKYKHNSSAKDGALLDSEDNLVDKQEPELDSPWNDLAKEPVVPQYRTSLEQTKANLPAEDIAATDKSTAKNAIPPQVSATTEQQRTVLPSGKNKKSTNSKMAGLLIVFFLIVGVFASYLLVKQNQDTRQQAKEIICDTTIDPYCDESTDGTDCGSGRTLINGNCYSNTCRISPKDNTNIICGYETDKDACTEESLGGDWCDNPNTAKTETCEEAGLLRCHCSNKWWSIGTGKNADGSSSCATVCKNSNAVCTNCSSGGGDDDDDEPTPTPTPPVEPYACGEFGCTQNDDCVDGYTCQSVAVDNQSKGICALGENQLFCAADPTTDNCCVSQAMPVCASIEMLDANNNLLSENDDDDLTVGDEVRFRCSAVGNQDVDFNYEFRIWIPGTSAWLDLTDDSGTVAKNVSDLYAITSYGKYVVQGRICWGTECQVWETVSGAPTTTTDSTETVTNSTCATGQVFASTPPGGCPVVNGQQTACASAPYCRQAEGTDCETSSDCYDGYTCYQPPMPTCPAGSVCTQVMPDKYCTAETDLACNTDSDCPANSGYSCYQPDTITVTDSKTGSVTTVVPEKYCKVMPD